MTKYLKSEPFSVNVGGEGYAEGWERTFGKRPTETDPPAHVRKFVMDCINERDGRAPCTPVSDIRRQVEEFHEAFGQPVVHTPTVPCSARVRLRLRLITEEYFELLEACGLEGEYFEDLRDQIGATIGVVDGGDVDVAEVADALGDLDYVIEGTRLEFGLNGQPIADEIHRSNMSKLVDGKPTYNEAGKVAKPPSYSAADVKGELVKQGWKCPG